MSLERFQRDSIQIIEKSLLPSEKKQHLIENVKKITPESYARQIELGIQALKSHPRAAGKGDIAIVNMEYAATKDKQELELQRVSAVLLKLHLDDAAQAMPEYDRPNMIQVNLIRITGAPTPRIPGGGRSKRHTVHAPQYE